MKVVCADATSCCSHMHPAVYNETSGSERVSFSEPNMSIAEKHDHEEQNGGEGGIGIAYPHCRHVDARHGVDGLTGHANWQPLRAVYVAA